MKIIKTYKNFCNESINFDLKKELKKHLIKNKYLYHYTLTDYLDDIKTDGLIPKKNPNSYYKDGANGIFLTTSDSLYKANLPQSLMDVMDDYYENENLYDEKPIVRLTIDVTKLDADKLIYDDDYILNKYGWNKATTKEEQIIESLNIWGSVAYLDIIKPEYIVKHDYKYSS